MNNSFVALSKNDVLNIHTATILRFGGLDGIRDEGLLNSALAQPFQTYGGIDIYSTAAQKAARYAYGIIANHPFVDGNKRTATAAMATFLRVNGYRFAPKHDELLEMMLGTAAGVVSFEQLAEWVDAVLLYE